MQKYNIPIPRGNLATNAKEAVVIARKFGPDHEHNFVVKAQVHCKGRSKGYFRESGLKSGIHSVANLDKLSDVVEKMCGNHFVLPDDKQGLGERGYLCRSALVFESLSMKHEILL